MIATQNSPPSMHSRSRSHHSHLCCFLPRVCCRARPLLLPPRVPERRNRFQDLRNGAKTFPSFLKEQKRQQKKLHSLTS